MIRTTTISFGNANIGEVYRLPQQYVKQCSEPLQPESGPQKAGLDPVGKVGNSGDGLARRQRQAHMTKFAIAKALLIPPGGQGYCI